MGPPRASGEIGLQARMWGPVLLSLAAVFAAAGKVWWTAQATAFNRVVALQANPNPSPNPNPNPHPHPNPNPNPNRNLTLTLTLP